MYNLVVTHDGVEIYRQTVHEGTYRLGRSESNDLPIPSQHMSRHHMQIEVAHDQVWVTDLGSTNGVMIAGRSLVPNQPAGWPPSTPLRVGPLQVELIASSSAEQSSHSPQRRTHVPTVMCAQGTPSMVALDDNIVSIGSAASSSMRVTLPGMAPRHCTVRLYENVVEVISHDPSRPVLLNGLPIPPNKPTAWEQGQILQVGPASCTQGELSMGEVMAYEAQMRQPAGQSRNWAAVGVVGALVLFFVAAVVASGIYFFVLRDNTNLVTDNGTDGGPATPTLQQRTIATAAGDELISSIITLAPTTDGPSIVSTSECDTTAAAVASVGFLDLPFPYRGIEPSHGGTSEQFRIISQRSAFGGRINSFFDHEYPIYPPQFGGKEPAGLERSLVIFDGSRSADNFSMDANSGDWYSGHSGIDFAPAEPRKETTPILAAADGEIILVKEDLDGNHMVWLRHDPPDGEDVKYATLYFHLAPDAEWDRMVTAFAAAQANGQFDTVKQGDRIGTMGTTGRSSGIHLHFEVRKDVDGDGLFKWWERVDPYGFFPSPEIPVDPWALPTLEWTDSRGTEYNIEGVVSNYLWEHALTGDIEDSGGNPCAIDVQGRVAVDLYNVRGWTVVHPGFTLILRNENGDIVDTDGRPHYRELTIPAEKMEGIDLLTVTLDYFVEPTATDAGGWKTNSNYEGLKPQADGSYTYQAELLATGRYVLVGRPTSDTIAPSTSIRLEGVLIDGEQNTFRDVVLVTLTGKEFDTGHIQPSGLRYIEYSLDCGTTWNIYTEPFEVTADTPGCQTGESEESETISLGNNEFILLAIATDLADNVEQPASQVSFTIDSP